MKWTRRVDKKKVAWGMLISHHPPCQYDRTFCLFNIRFCTRCTGIFIGVLCGYAVSEFVFREHYRECINIISLVLPVPAVMNFTLNELGKTGNNTLKRITTGVLLGSGIGGGIVYNLWHNSISWGLIILFWIILLEIITAVVLHKANKLEDFFAQYEDIL